MTVRKQAREARKAAALKGMEPGASGRPTGKNGHRDHYEREADLEKVARLARLGYSNGEIVVEMDGKVGRRQIEKDLATIRQRHLDSMIADRRIMAMEALEGIRHVRKEAWLAWLRSQLDAEQVVDKSGANGGGNYSEQVHRKVGQVGNAEFLKLIHETIKRECELFGLDEPLKVDLTGGMTINWFDMCKPTKITVDPIEEIIRQEREQGRITMESIAVKEGENETT